MRFRKTSLLVKLTLLILLVGATTMLVSLQSQIQQIEAANAEKEQQLNLLTQENEKLKAVNDDMAEYQSAYQSAVQAVGMEILPQEPATAEDSAEVVYPAEVNTMQIVAGIDSSAMEEAARQQGYVNSDEIIFEDINN